MTSLLFLSFVFSLSLRKIQVQAKAESSILTCEDLSEESKLSLIAAVYVALIQLWFDSKLCSAGSFVTVFPLHDCP